MTEIRFHVNVPNAAIYTCRLVRKAVRSGAKVTISGPPPMLAQLDKTLWEFEPLEFIPHVMPRAGQPLPSRLQETPVWLVADLDRAAHHDVLVNLHDDAPPGFESFGRVVEIVANDEAALAAGRRRWRHYATRGYAPEKHEVST